MKRELTCIVCPLGCNLEIGFQEGGKEIAYIKGNTCARGKAYAEEECIRPSRVITTTVACTDGGVIPVKTARPIPKGKIFECMAEINRAKADLPIRIGDVIIKNILDTDSDIIATVNKEK